MLCIYKDCNSTEDKVWSMYRNKNTSTNTNIMYLQTLQQQRKQSVLDFPKSRSLYRRRQIELLGKTAWVIPVIIVFVTIVIITPVISVIISPE